MSPRKLSLDKSHPSTGNDSWTSSPVDSFSPPAFHSPPPSPTQPVHVPTSCPTPTGLHSSYPTDSPFAAMGIVNHQSPTAAGPGHFSLPSNSYLQPMTRYAPHC